LISFCLSRIKTCLFDKSIVVLELVEKILPEAFYGQLKENPLFFKN